jgi:hypothetical protein
MLLGGVALLSCTYSPGMLFPGAPTEERVGLSVVVVLAWAIGWKIFQPIRAWKLLKVDTSHSPTGGVALAA